MSEKVAVLIPVYNDSAGLEEFLPVLINELAKSEEKWKPATFDVVVVDDGSFKPLDLKLISKLKLDIKLKVHLLRHPINLGQGAALQTAIDYSRKIIGSKTFITMDSDGQHSELDIFPLLMTIDKKGVDIVFGNRFAEGHVIGIPFFRKIILKLAVIFEKYLTGLDLKDAHNGYRVFNRNCADLIDLKLNRMAHATEIKQLVKKYDMSYAEHPVNIRYTPQSLAKGQKNTGSLIILKDLLTTYLFERL